MKSDLVTCLGCGWVYFQVSEAFVQDWEKTWEKYWPTLDQEGRESFGLPDGPPSRASYLKCRCGNPYTNFRDAKKGDSPDGCTINPILNRSEACLSPVKTSMAKKSRSNPKKSKLTK